MKKIAIFIFCLLIGLTLTFFKEDLLFNHTGSYIYVLVFFLIFTRPIIKFSKNLVMKK